MNPVFFKIISILSIAITLSGCIRTNSGNGYLSNGMIVERSKEFRPDWVGEDPGEIISSQNESHFVISRIKLINLSLGLKQMDSVSASMGRNILINHFKNILTKQYGKDLTKEYSFKLENFIASTFDKSDKELFFVKDIYYEKIQLTDQDKQGSGITSTYYNTYALITFPHKNEAEWLNELRKFLAESSDHELAEMGKALKSQDIKAIAH